MTMRFDPVYIVTNTVLSNNNRSVSMPTIDAHVAIFERKYGGKWYFEFKADVGGNAGSVGIQACDPAIVASDELTDAVAMWTITIDGHRAWDNGVDRGVVSGGTPGWVTNDIMMVALDIDAGKIWYGRNGSWLNSGDPATATNPVATGVTSTRGFCPAVSGYHTVTTNFTVQMKSSECTYSPPSGFTCWGNSARTLDPYNKTTGATLSNGNRTISGVPAGNIQGAMCDQGIYRPTYFEAVFDSPGAAGRIGIGISASQNITESTTAFIAFTSGSVGAGDHVCVTDDGLVYDQSTVKYTGTAFDSDDILMFAYNPSDGKVYVGRNGSWWNGGDPAAGTGYVHQVASNRNRTYKAGVIANNTGGNFSATVNFGSVAPTYEPPVGYAMMGAHYATVPTSAAAAAAHAVVRKRVATVATSVAAATAFAGARKFAVTVATSVAAATAFTPTKRLYATLAAAVGAATAMSARGTYHVSMATAVGVVTVVDQSIPPYIGYVANRELGAHSTYDAFDFNSMVCYDGVYYGARADGIYVLDGETDVDGDEIAARIRTGRDNLEVDQQKRVPVTYVGIRATGTMQMKVVEVDGTTSVYDMAVSNPHRALARAKIGRGRRDVTWQFELTNTGGVDFDADVIEVYPVVLQRRVP